MTKFEESTKLTTVRMDKEICIIKEIANGAFIKNYKHKDLKIALKNENLVCVCSYTGKIDRDIKKFNDVGFFVKDIVLGKGCEKHHQVRYIFERK